MKIIIDVGVYNPAYKGHRDLSLTFTEPLRDFYVIFTAILAHLYYHQN
jgi:hypothetical protein